MNNTTALDHGFLRDILTPGLLGRYDSPTAEFEFLQEIVFAFSSSGDEADPNAVAPLRPKDLAEMKLAQFRSQGWDGGITPFEFDLRQQAIARGENPDDGLFGKYQKRMQGYRAFFTENDKKILGEAYEMASGNEADLKRIDKLAAELGVLRLQQQLAGELLRGATNQGEADAPYEADSAHLAILGEMRRMSAASAA
jgi:hypothetical protein